MTIEVVEFIQSFENGFFDFFFNMISFLGEEYVYIVLLSIIYFTYNKKMGEYLAFLLMFAGLFNNTLKEIVNADRPFKKYEDRVVNKRPGTSTGQSFPSGHTQIFTSFLYGEAFYIKQTRMLIVTSVLAVLMCLSRMYLGVHFLEDVLVALLLGILTAYIASLYFKKYGENEKVLLNTYLIILLIFIPFLFIFDAEDLFKSYGMFAGFTLAMFIEKRYVNFSLDVSIKNKVLRVVIGLIAMILIKTLGSMLFELIADEGTMLMNILDMIRYFLIAGIGLGFYPMLFKKFNF